MGVEMMNFSFKGRAIDPESTASDLDIRDNNVVEVKPSQLLLSNSYLTNERFFIEKEYKRFN
jgi:hypothetical protein